MNTALQNRVLRPRIIGSDFNAKGELRLYAEVDGFSIVFEPSPAEQLALLENIAQSLRRRFVPVPQRNRVGQ